jgi:hypothetical protein
MIFFKWNACHYKQDILNQIDLIRPFQEPATGQDRLKPVKNNKLT